PQELPHESGAPRANDDQVRSAACGGSDDASSRVGDADGRFDDGRAAVARGGGSGQRGCELAVPVFAALQRIAHLDGREPSPRSGAPGAVLSARANLRARTAAFEPSSARRTCRATEVRRVLEALRALFPMRPRLSDAPTC